MTHPAPSATASLLTFPCAFPIKTMGRRTDDFAQAVLAVVLRHAPDFDSRDRRDARLVGRQVPVGDLHDQRHVARAARQPVPGPLVAPAGVDGALMADSSTLVLRPPAFAPGAAERIHDPALAGPVIRALGRTDYETTWRAMQAFTEARLPQTARRDLADRAPAASTRWASPAGTSTCCATTASRCSGSTAAGRSPTTVRASSSRTCSIDLRRRGLGVRDMVRAIEAAVVEWLAAQGIAPTASRPRPASTCSAPAARPRSRRWGSRCARGCTLPRRQRERRDGPLAVRRHRPLRLAGPRRDAARRLRRAHERRRRRHRARSRAGAAPRATRASLAAAPHTAEQR